MNDTFKKGMDDFENQGDQKIEEKERDKLEELSDWFHSKFKSFFK